VKLDILDFLQKLLGDSDIQQQLTIQNYILLLTTNGGLRVYDITNHQSDYIHAKNKFNKSQKRHWDCRGVQHFD
jgi:hypothetical protein